MKRIIVFRFHKLPELCAERIQYLKHMNPNIEIFGLFGGESDQVPLVTGVLGSMLNDIFCLMSRAPAWKWRFGDLAILEWFTNVGINVSFDVAHLVEWDLLLCGPIGVLYQHVPQNSLGLTSIRQVKDVETLWPPTNTEPFSLEWKNLLTWAQRHHNYSATPLACLGPGVCLPRSFLNAYRRLTMPEISSDELRFPLAAQLLGNPVADTRFCRGWFVEDEWNIFNTLKREVLPSTVDSELQRKDGRRVFHPFRAPLTSISAFRALGLNSIAVA